MGVGVHALKSGIGMGIITCGGNSSTIDDMVTPIW